MHNLKTIYKYILINYLNLCIIKYRLTKIILNNKFLHIILFKSKLNYSDKINIL